MSKQIRKFAKLLRHEMRRQKWSDEQILSVIGAPEYQSIGQIVAGLKKHPSEIYAPDWIPAGCKVVEDVNPRQFEISDLEWWSFYDEKDELTRVVEPETMLDRAKLNDANFGLVDGKRIWERREQIAPEIRGTFHIVLAGTRLFDSADGREKICIMLWSEGHLIPKYLALKFGWYNYQRLPRIRHV